jgi:hypothetical protein
MALSEVEGRSRARLFLSVDNHRPVHYEFTEDGGGLTQLFPQTALPTGERPFRFKSWIEGSKMPRRKKKIGRPRKAKSRGYLEEHNHEDSDEGLPSDEAGRLKIKKSYEELLGVRIDKLKGRVLNREKINKSIDGIYFICFACKKICHNLDEGLVEEAQTLMNYCAACGKANGIKAAAG